MLPSSGFQRTKIMQKTKQKNPVSVCHFYTQGIWFGGNNDKDH